MLSTMKEISVGRALNRLVGLHISPDAPSSSADEAKVPQRGDANKVPMLFALARRVAAVLLVALLIAYFIVAFCVDEYRTIWPRGETSSTK
jgi:hypothetical protein